MVSQIGPIKTLDYYLLKETVKPLLFSIVALTIILISSYLFELTDFIIMRQVPLLKVLELLLYKIPTIMVDTFSISLLFATILSLSGLVTNNEFTAFRMGGYSLPRIIIPLLFMALIVSGGNFIINEHLAPWTNHRARNIIRESILRDPSPHVQQDVFFSGPGDRFYYVGEIDEKEAVIRQILIYTLNPEEGYPQIITAPLGNFSQDEWFLQNGVIHNLNRDGRVNYEVTFKELSLNVGDEAAAFFGRQRTPSEMSREELGREIALFSRSGINVASLLVEYHLKLAMPLAGFIFVIIGAPLSLLSRKGRTVGIISSVVVVLLYYVLLSLCRSLGRSDLLSPLLAAWIPNIVFISIGLILIFRQEFLRFRWR